MPAYYVLRSNERIIEEIKAWFLSTFKHPPDSVYIHSWGKNVIYSQISLWYKQKQRFVWCHFYLFCCGRGSPLTLFLFLWKTLRYRQESSSRPAVSKSPTMMIESPIQMFIALASGRRLREFNMNMSQEPGTRLS